MSATPTAPPSPVPPAPSPGDRQRPSWWPSRRSLLLVALAFLAGLALFIAVWRGDRDNAFYKVEPVARPLADGTFEPLPAPLPAGSERSASGMREGSPEPTEPPPRIVERAPAPEPPPVAVPSEPPPSGRPLARGDAPEPIPTRMPAPDYPRRALRRGVEGTVLVRAEVGPDGVPTSVSLVQSSRSRDLDRAALEAVRRWRFRPAQVGGRPTVGTVVVPIDFRADR